MSRDNWRDEGHDGWGGDEDPLAPARGCMVAMAIGAAFWIAAFVIWKLVTR